MALPLVAVFSSSSPRAAVAGEIIDEIKAGVLNHDVAFLGHHKENGIDTNIEVLLASPGLLSVIGTPRPDVGISINSAGKTDQLYGGLTWTADLVQDVLLPKDGIFLSGSLGGAANNGKQDGAWRNHKILGSPLLFRESAEIGYRFHASYTLSLVVDHSSDGGLSSRNQGLTNAGARLGILF